MTDYEYIGTIGIKLIPQSEYFFLEPNCKSILEDLLFFLKISKACYVLKIINFFSEISKRFTRISILSIALYFESLANLLFGDAETKFNNANKLEKIFDEIQKDDKGDRYPKPLRKFLAVYYAIYNENLPLDVQGIQDLFLIRNKVIAHPKASSIIAGTNVVKGKGLTEKGGPVNYKKFTNFPNYFNGFTYQEAKKLYNEIRWFLAEFRNLIVNNYSDIVSPTYFILKKLK